MGGCLSRSSLMEFLIVLKTSDYEAASCPLASSYSTKVKRSEDDLPGILHVVSITPFNISNADFYGIKKLKNVKSIVGISPTMVLLFLLLFLFLKK